MPEASKLPGGVQVIHQHRTDVVFSAASMAAPYWRPRRGCSPAWPGHRARRKTAGALRDAPAFARLPSPSNDALRSRSPACRIASPVPSCAPPPTSATIPLRRAACEVLVERVEPLLQGPALVFECELLRGQPLGAQRVVLLLLVEARQFIAAMRQRALQIDQARLGLVEEPVLVGQLAIELPERLLLLLQLCLLGRETASICSYSAFSRARSCS